MPSMTVRNVPDEVHRGLRLRAALHQRSMEAEIREILDAAIRPSGRLKLGSLLVQIGQEVGLSDAEVDLFETAGSGFPASAASFE